ncbi:MAG: hypothetical protein ACPGF7_10385, partial [Pontibacterium sp.]
MSNSTKVFHNIIHLGAGSKPPIGKYIETAENIWLVDASQQIIDVLQASISRNLGVFDCVKAWQALVDCKSHSSTFYEYNFEWASGLKVPGVAQQYLYPGLKCLKCTEQLSTGISDLLAGLCLDLNAENLLIIDLNKQAGALLEELEASGWLNAFTMIAVLPPHRDSITLNDLPVSLHPLFSTPEFLNEVLPKSEQYQLYSRHPLVDKNQHLTQQFQDVQQTVETKNQELSEARRLTKVTEEQREALTQQLQDVQQTVETKNQELSEAR